MEFDEQPALITQKGSKMKVTIKHKDGSLYRIIPNAAKVKLETTYGVNYSCDLLVNGDGKCYRFDTGRFDFEITEGEKA